MSNDSESKLHIACIQMEPVFGESEHNRAHLSAMIEKAAAAGAKLIIAPELCISGYVFRSRDEARMLAEPASDGATAKEWEKLARKHDAWIVGGICEREGTRLYNSAIVVGPDGYQGVYRKVHLWGDESLYFERGDKGFPVFDTKFGRLGVLICYDQWFPEAYRSCALNGADIVCVPTAWVPIPGQDPNREAMANIVAMAAAHSNSVFVACADRIGTERGQPFIGQSLIVSYTGWPAGGPASADKEEIVFATVNVSDARRKRRWNDFNDIIRDRRVDTYQLR